MPIVEESTAEPVPVSVTCDSCDEIIPEDEDAINVRGQDYCDVCYDNYCQCCRDCSNNFRTDDMFFIEHLGDYVCTPCYESNGYFLCMRCDERCSSSSESSERSGMCENCYMDEEPDEDDDYDNEVPNLENGAQSNEIGRVIKSLRRFGVELETLYNRTDAISKASKLLPSWGFQGDGSIRSTKDALNGIEMVSPILKGRAGEEEIEKVGEQVRSFGYFVNQSCGFHLHLESLDFKREPSEDRPIIDKDEPDHKVVGYKFHYNGRSHTVNRLSDIPHDSSTNERLKYEIITGDNDEAKKRIVNTGANFLKLRELWYVYTMFDDVFRAMQPASRRNNTFCRSTASLYSLDMIADLKDFSELEIAWYRIDKRYKLENRLLEVRNRKTSIKDETRYCGFNMAPILANKGKTIEIRYHSPTLNAEKILRWIDIHQTIFDRVSEGSYPVDVLLEIQARETNVVQKAMIMAKVFKFDPDTREYMLQRLEKFNSIKRSEVNSEDEEVEPSEQGRPLHNSNVNFLRRPESFSGRIYSNRIRMGSPQFIMDYGDSQSLTSNDMLRAVRQLRDDSMGQQGVNASGVMRAWTDDNGNERNNA